MTQDDFDSYYLKHFELIKKQVMEKKSLDKEKRRQEEDGITKENKFGSNSSLDSKSPDKGMQ